MITNALFISPLATVLQALVSRRLMNAVAEDLMHSGRTYATYYSESEYVEGFLSRITQFLRASCPCTGSIGAYDLWHVA